jgi:hypothetical protein
VVLATVRLPDSVTAPVSAVDPIANRHPLPSVASLHDVVRCLVVR